MTIDTIDVTLDAARRGELDRALDLLRARRTTEPHDAGSFALAAVTEVLVAADVRASVTGARGPLVSDAFLAGLASGSRPAGADAHLARGLLDVALHAVLLGDPARLVLARRASVALPEVHALVVAWDDLLHERPVDVGALIETAHRARHVPGLLAEAEALAALLEFSSQRLDAARERARLASRMARTDGWLATEYLANLVLARVRRFEDRWYLASRILDALTRAAPPPWSGWLAWEHVLVGSGPRVASLVGRGPWLDAASELARAIEAAAHGDRARFDASTNVPMPWPLLARERRRVAALVDVGADAPEELRAWLEGEGQRAPHGMDGLAGSASLLGAGTERAGVVVIADVARRARRVLVGGLGLLGQSLPATYELQHERVLAGLVALLFAPGARARDEELFRRVYGFAFVPDKHGGVLRTLLYRMRQELGARGEISRADDLLVLHVRGPLAIPDPTTATDLRELVLRFLADHGGRASARDVAEALGVPLRTVQDALGQLVGDESCRRERSGRVHEYALEDTTFFAPTITRLGAWRDALR